MPAYSSMPAYSTSTPAYSTHDEGHSPLAAAARMMAGRRSRISWGAILAGAVTAASTFVLLSLLGVAIGAGGLRFTETAASDLAANYGLGAGIWTALNLILSLAFGGYVASRLSGTHSHLDAELHGITVWGVTILLMSLLLTQAISSILGTAASTAGSAVGGSASSLVGAAASQVGGGAGLVRQLEQGLLTNGDPTQMSREQINAEIATLAGRRVINGSLSDPDRDRLTTLVAAQAGISKDEAARRVARMEQDAQNAVSEAGQRARRAGEVAARDAAATAKALFSSLLLGLAGALVGAWIGTRHARVLRPHEEDPGHEVHTTTTVTHHPYEPTMAPVHGTTVLHDPVTTTSSPVAARVYDDAGRTVPAYLRSASFPATKQELLRLARLNNDDPTALRRLELVPDRSYSSINDLMSVLLTTA